MIILWWLSYDHKQWWSYERSFTCSRFDSKLSSLSCCAASRATCTMMVTIFTTTTTTTTEPTVTTFNKQKPRAPCVASAQAKPSPAPPLRPGAASPARLSGATKSITVKWRNVDTTKWLLYTAQCAFDLHHRPVKTLILCVCNNFLKDKSPQKH